MKIALLCSLALFVAPTAPRTSHLALRPHQGGQVVIGQNASDHDKQEARRHNQLGNEALHTEKYEEAEREFQTAIKLDATYELPRYGLGQTYMAMKRYPAAITAFKECRDVFHANAAADSGDDLKRQRRVDDLIDDLENQKRTYQSAGHGGAPASQQVRQYIQEINAQLSTLKEERSRKTTADDQPTPAWLSLGLGSAYFRTDAYADAEREYRNAIQVNPKLGEAHNNLAVLLFVTGRAAEASTELNAAEKAGFKVNPQLKEDIRAALKKT